jgi:hypothetical protein
MFWQLDVNASLVDWPALNLNCLPDVSLCLMIYFHILLSVHYYRGVTEVYSCLDHVYLCFNGRGIVSQFHGLGIQPLLKSNWKSFAGGLPSLAAHDFSTLAGIESGPVAFPGSSLYSICRQNTAFLRLYIAFLYVGETDFVGMVDFSAKM